jgi:flagellin
MTRINTNVSSLVAQNRLNRTNAELNTSLTRLSTGLRINTGKDDPAGLIASEALRSDITSINKALSNTQRASQIIATADSALGQVSSLLNDIRGLVVEAANNGALSDDEIAANQLQIDSSLEAINRISQTTTFQGRRLLDGSLDFVTSAGAGFSSVADLKIDQANLGAAGRINVNVNISAAATRAQISSTGIPAATTPAYSTGTISFGSPVAAAEASGTANFANSFTVGAEATGTIAFANSFTPNAQAAGNLSLGSGISLTVTAEAGQAADGLAGNSTIIEVTTRSSGSSSATYDSSTNTLTLDLVEGADISTILADLSVAEFSFADNSSANTVLASDAGMFTGVLSGGSNTVASAGFELTARNNGAADGAKGNDTRISVTSGVATSASYDAETDLLSITVAAGATIADIAAAINTGAGADFIASNVTNGSYFYSSTDNTIPGSPLTGQLSGGTNPTLAAAFDIEAVDGQAADGTAGNGVTLQLSSGATTAAQFDADLGQLMITVAQGATIQDIASAIDATGVFLTRNVQNGNALFSSSDLGANDPGLTGGTDDTANDVITVRATEDSADFDGRTITVNATNSLAAGTANAALDSNGNIVVTVSNLGNGVTMGAIATAIDRLDGFAAEVTSSNGDGVYRAGSPNPDSAPTIVNLQGGQFGGGLAADLDVRLTGATGSEVFEFKKGTSLDLMIQSINLVSDATGIRAENDGGNLRLTSTGYGSKALIDVDVIREGSGGQFTSGLTAARANGSDIVATVNGTSATGKGNTLSVNTATLDLSLTVNEGSNTSVNFTITGGGAQFQLGPEVVSNQQARLGITSVNTAKLGSANGRLYELGSGGSKSLVNDATGAARVINDVINVVTNLRGRLGAFQATTLESNLNSLSDTVSNLTEAESSIRDADFAAESARLTRAQILVQSGTSVLGIANQNPQNVLGLLR